MAHRLGFGETGQIQLALAAQATQSIVGNLDVGQIDAGMVAIADFEQERFGGQKCGRSTGGGGSTGLGCGRAALGVHAHASSPLSASTSAAISP